MAAMRGIKIGRAVLGLATLTTIAACNQETAKEQDPVRQIRTQVVEIKEWQNQGSTIGEIKPRYESDIGFRISGKMASRPVDVGSVLEKGTLIATLDSTNENTAVSLAETEIRSAQADLNEAAAQEARQRELLQRGYGTQAAYDAVERRSKMARARLEAVQLAKKDATERLSYTELRADDAGVVTAVGANVGQVVSAGQIVVRVARSGVKEAEFKVSERILRSVPQDTAVAVILVSDPKIKATGNIREIATTADAITRTFAVRVSLSDPPDAMRFGATVQGQVVLNEKGIIQLPSSALFQSENQPAVWVFDSSSSSVKLRPVTVLRYETDVVLISDGLTEGERVVTAGVHKLLPGMKVRL
jgi:RND family efflux transporter MFP subunit